MGEEQILCCDYVTDHAVLLQPITELESRDPQSMTSGLTFYMALLTLYDRGITLPSLATAAKTITEAGSLLCITGGTSEESEAIIRVFCLFATSPTTNFFSSKKTLTCPPLCFRWFRSIGHISALRALERGS